MHHRDCASASLPRDAHLPSPPPQGGIRVLPLLAQRATARENLGPAHCPREEDPALANMSSLGECFSP